MRRKGEEKKRFHQCWHWRDVHKQNKRTAAFRGVDRYVFRKEIISHIKVYI